ncbi:MAG: hypothetical protein IJK53_10340 [Erysipelotrichaceae bacterium]|nr:hypothetical protein [Clostridia bacterium]MBQ6217768.1 hypothetical protein [Erysipelotrichaceae bacterium]
MEEIILSRIDKTENTLFYEFHVTENLERFFSGKSFQIQYPDNIEMIPDSIASIPFVCSVLPIVWLTDSVLTVSELDESFYNCIPEVKNGYENMYSETTFLGKIKVEKIIRCDRAQESNKCAMFYSGGVDSVHTLINHIEEKPTLLTIWGSDITFDNQKGWNNLYRALKEVSDRYKLDLKTIHSSFRVFDSERELDKTFSESLKDGWWHGVKHGIALLGHAAPYAYLHNLEKIYIASSNCPEDGKVRCASNPAIDNKVKFANCQVFHDGFECNRQKKIKNIVHYSDKTNDYPPLHVCWETQTGDNCCKCEKCYRTIVGIIAEGGEPELYGFKQYKHEMKDMQQVVLRGLNKNLVLQWKPIRNALSRNKDMVKNNMFWKDIRWILKADFDHPETIRIVIPLSAGIRPWLSQFAFYQRLHNLKEKIK